MIPVEIDAMQMITDLNGWGWRDSKIEVVCGFSKGYVAQIRFGNVRMLAYQRAARLFNFWTEEQAKAPAREASPPVGLTGASA